MGNRAQPLEKIVIERKPEILRGYWTDTNNKLIWKTYFGQTVKFHIVTRNIANGSILKLQVYENGGVKDTRIGSEKSVTVNENKAILDFYIRRDWESLIQSGADTFDATIELYVAAKYNDGNSVKLANTKATWLNVTLAIYIYLTFDDGIGLGTEDVLNILQETGVNATFFLTGSNSTTDKRQELLKRIYENHAIGNHSYYHASYPKGARADYGKYYKGGGVMVRGKLVSVIEDFKENEKEFTLWIKEFDPTYSKLFMMAKNQTKALARLPGTNTWRTPQRSSTKITHRKTIELAGINFPGEIPQADSKEEADEINQYGYSIFGWDEEWKMSSSESESSVRRRLFSMPPVSTEFTPAQIVYWQTRPIVLLMHDRQFLGERGGQLKTFINTLKKNEGIFFDTLDNYVM